jgi:hypothetical protein
MERHTHATFCILSTFKIQELKMMATKMKYLVALLFVLGTTNGFIVHPTGTLLRTKTSVAVRVPVPTPFSAPPRLLSTKLHGEPLNFGQERGAVLQGLVLLLCVWSFSIPPEFRRAHFCPTERCEENRVACHDCITTSEWVSGIQEYYKNGGGIEFDFTVAQETKDLWSGGR